MFNLHDIKSRTNDSLVYKLINEKDKEILAQLFNRTDEITTKLKAQVEDYHYDFNFLNPQSNVLLNKWNKLSKDNADLCRSVIVSGDVQAQIEIYHMLFKNSMDSFSNNQSNTDTNQHHSNESVKESLIPDAHNLFRNFQGKATGGLMGNVLAKSAVKMVFIFMQRLWRDSNEIDVESCAEVMRSAIEEIQEIPVAGFFNLCDGNESLPFWSGVTEQTYQFLRNTVLCIDTNDLIAPKPIRDAALVLILEMGLIYGSLSMQLKHVIMLIELSSGSNNYAHLSAGETVKPMVTGCILPVLTRLAKFVRKSLDSTGHGSLDRSIQISSNPCLRLLSWMHLDQLKEDESLNTDFCLLNAAVFIMSCLDSFTIENQLLFADWYKTHLVNNLNANPLSYQNNNSFVDAFSSNDKSSHKLVLIRMNPSQGLLKGDSRDSKIEIIDIKSEKLPREENEKFRVRKVVCSGVNTYVLTDGGWLYEISTASEDVIESFTFKHNAINYKFDTLKNDSPSKLSSTNKIVDVDANVYSSHVLAVTESGQIFSWGSNTSGKLGHGDTKDRRRPTVIDGFHRSCLPVKQVVCGEEHSLILTQSGEIYACGRNHMGQLGLGDTKDRLSPTRLSASQLLGVQVRQIAVDGHQSMCVTNDGIILTWGSTFDNCRRHCINWSPHVEACVHEYRHEIDQIHVHDSTYTILTRSGSVYTWLKYCTDCNKPDESVPDGCATDTVVKYQLDNVSLIAKGDGEFYFLDKSGLIRTKKLYKLSDHKFASFGFIKRHWMLAWTVAKDKRQLTRPFVLEVSMENLELLSRLIGAIIVNFEPPIPTATNTDNTPGTVECNWFQQLPRPGPASTAATKPNELTEDRLCILVSCLHLLAVQLQTMVEQHLTVNGTLLARLKRDIITCCCGPVSPLHAGVRRAAHMCLIAGWPMLFASQLEKLLGIHHTLQLADPTWSRYNLIVAMCLDTVDMSRLIGTLVTLSTSADPPSIDCFIETVVRYAFAHIRAQLRPPPPPSNTTQKSKSNTSDLPLFDQPSEPSDRSIIDKLLVFLHGMVQQCVLLLKDSNRDQSSNRTPSTNNVATAKLIITVYGKMLAQQSVDIMDQCWSLLCGKWPMGGRQIVSALNESGFTSLIIHFTQSIRWLLANYLPVQQQHQQTVSQPPHAKQTKSATTPTSNLSSSNSNPMIHYDALFKFSLNIRDIVFAFKPLIVALDRINRLNDESVHMVDTEDASLPGWLYNPSTMADKIDFVRFRISDLTDPDSQLIVIDDRVYDLDQLTNEALRKFDEWLPHRKSVFITDIVHRHLRRRDILDLLNDCYCGDFVDDEGRPLSFGDTNEATGTGSAWQLYLIERLLLSLASDVLLFHQSCWNCVKQLINFRQLQEFSHDKFPPALHQIVLKKKTGDSSIPAGIVDTGCPNSIVSFGHFEEKERDEVEETIDSGTCQNGAASCESSYRKLVSTCINLLTWGSASQLLDKGTSITANIVQWLRSDAYRSAGGKWAAMDNIHDGQLDSLCALVLVALVRHMGICDELASHIVRRRQRKATNNGSGDLTAVPLQPMSSDLQLVTHQAISVRKDIIKRHQTTSVPYKDLCASVAVRCRFLIDEIECLGPSSNTTTWVASPTQHRWKSAALKAISKKPPATHKRPHIDYWQIVYNSITRQSCHQQHAKTAVTSKYPTSNHHHKPPPFDTSEFCQQITQFLLNRDPIDLHKLRTLILAKKIQYKCLVNVLREWRSLLQFGSGLMPGAQVSLLQFWAVSIPLSAATSVNIEHVDTGDSGDHHDDHRTTTMFDILRAIHAPSASNCVSPHMRQSLHQAQHALVHTCQQLLRDQLLANERRLQRQKCYKQPFTVAGVGHWPNGKLVLAMFTVLLQSLHWTSTSVDLIHVAVSNGLLALVQTVLRQYHETQCGLVSIWCRRDRNYQLLTSDGAGSSGGLSLATTKDRCESADDVTGSAIATPSQLKKGMLVLRGRDWKYGDQDGPNSVGVVTREAIHGMVRVKWLNNNKTGSYRAGKDNYYDLRLKKGIEDVNGDNSVEFGMRSLMKDISLLQEKFLANRLMRQQSTEFSRSPFARNKHEEKPTIKETSSLNWTQPSMLLLHSVGQLMQAIVIQQFIANHSSKITTMSLSTTNKIHQLLWLIYNNGILFSMHKNDCIKNMYQEQIYLWCNESFLLTLLNQNHCHWPDGDLWIDLFLTRAEIQIKQFSNENVSNQILTLKIIERFVDRNSVKDSVLDRLWNCFELAINSHCCQDFKLVFNINSFNASPSKIRIMELSIIFRNMLRTSSVNQCIVREFLFGKIAQCSSSQPENQVQYLALFCLFADIENRIYHGVPVCRIGDQNEAVYCGIVQELGSADNEKYVITTVPFNDSSMRESSTVGFDCKSNCHTLTTDMKIDASKVCFPFEIFQTLSDKELEIILIFLSNLLSNFAGNSEQGNLYKASVLEIQFNVMRLLTVMEFCEHNLTELWYPVYQSNHHMLQLALNIASRTCSVKPSISIYEIGRALNQLSINLCSTANGDVIVLSDNDKGTDTEIEMASTVQDSKTKRTKSKNWKASSNSRQSKTKPRRSSQNHKFEPLNISSDLQYRIMEMGFTKRQIQSAVRELICNGSSHLISNPELIITTILSLQNEDNYSLSPGENVDDDEDDEDDEEEEEEEDSNRITISDDDDGADDDDSSCSTVSDDFYILPRRKLRHAINSTADQSLNTSDNDDHIEDGVRNDNADDTNDDGDNSHSLNDEDNSDEEKSLTSDIWRHTKNEINAIEDVICIKSFGSVSIGDRGTLRLTDDGKTDHYSVFWTKLNQLIETDKTNVHISTSPYSPISVGDEVQFSDAGIKRYSVSTITAFSTGVVRQIIGHASNMKLVVDFPNCIGQICHASDLKSVAKNHQNFQCRSCLQHPLSLPVYACKSCKNLYLCADCFTKFKKNHNHKFLTISAEKETTHAKNPVSDGLSLDQSRKLRYPTISTSTKKSQLRQCLSFTNWLLNHQKPPFKQFEATINQNNCLFKVPSGYEVRKIFMLISLSEFLTLPNYVIVRSGSQTKKLAAVYRANVQSLKDDEIIINSSKYSASSKLMWLKVFQQKKNFYCNVSYYSLDLFDESSSISTVFNAVKSFHFHLKPCDSNSDRNCNENAMPDLSVSMKNENLLKTIFSISDKHWSAHAIDTICNQTVASWRQARLNRLRFQIESISRDLANNDLKSPQSPTNKDSINTNIEISSCQDDNKIQSGLKSKIYTWGLNDKDQLGCEATSKVKLPLLNHQLSELDCVSIVGGSKSLFCVTRTGKVYVAGDSSNGRLGIGPITDVVLGPKKLETLDKYFIVKVAVHSGGRHALALTKNGVVFSWGEGDDGKLGHNSRLKLDYPRKIKFFKGKRVVDISCGSSHSAAIVFDGQLFTWGLGDYGRLGHGDTSTRLIPELVKALRDYKVVQVACGSRDAQTLALTNDFNVWSWGDGDFGKLGRGGSSGCLIPQKIECISLKNVIQIECGAQSSFALTETGEVWTWGKGDYYRLGHGQDKHVREPMLVEDLKGIKIVHLAVGALHCLAVTDQGLVYSWGDNDHGQQGNGTVSYNMRPTLISSLANIKIAHVACGSSHSVAWTASDLDSFRLSQSLNRWPHIKEMSYSLAVIDFIPRPFQFQPDPLGSGDLLDIDDSIYQKKGKCIEPSVPQLPAFNMDEMTSCHNLSTIISQLRGSSTQACVIQSLFANLQVLIARKLVFQLISRRNSVPKISCQTDNDACDASQLSFNDQLSTMETFLLTFDYLKLQHSSATQSDDSLRHFLDNIDFSVSTNLRQTALLLLIDEIEKYGDKDTTKDNNIHHYCDNKDFLNIIRRNRSISVVRESSHPYSENSKLYGKVVIPGAVRLVVEFDRQCSTERNKDVLIIMDRDKSFVAQRSGQRWEDWGSKVIINGNEMHWSFQSDSSITAWGWRFEVKPLWKTNQGHKQADDYNDYMDYNELFILFLPNLRLIKGLLAKIDLQFEDTSLALQLVKSLSQMAFTRSNLDCESRIWAVRQITTIISNLNLGVLSQFMKAVESFSTILDTRLETRNAVMEEEIVEAQNNLEEETDEVSSDDEQNYSSSKQINDIDTICSFLLCLQKVVLKQFKFEEPEVKSSKQLFYTRFLKSLLELSCSIRLDSISPVSSGDEWAWFRNYCLTSRTTDSLVSGSSLPYRFVNEFKSRFLKDQVVRDSISRETNTLTIVGDYADPHEFGFQHDVQLVSWLKMRPDAWKKCWPTDSASGLEVWSWGHNHRGQLGGVEGSKIKVPVLCEHLSALRPKQIIGGEQSLFVVSIDGRVYATGFGNNGRLGIGSSESVQTPILVSGLEEKIVVKVAVNSGGKHCLALCNNGLVYAWGDAEDNKLGLDTRLQPCEDVLTPTLIKSLVKAEIVDIAAGGSHSAAISKSGELYTWGKGRYGRLGHGNGDDQPFPKIVEALRGYHVLGVACGSGDAQTLCITRNTGDNSRDETPHNTSVWSWGDGDYGKLGRGGFDICKLPMKIETLEGVGVIKVDCGSQFSLALTASGEVYTWGKGDYFRLGHGSDTHVRKPERVSQLNRKKIIDVACGSLHCICCTEDGEVYSWGDNDEGQLGDGTTTTNSRPRIIETLTGKGINRVACGSAHTLAWSTVSGNRSQEAESPDQKLSLATRPKLCELLENKSAQALINRFLLLHHWTDLFCSNLHFFDLNRQSLMDAARQILLPSSKESLFRLMIQTTMYGSKKHGPEIKVNRLHASAGTPAGVSILYRSGWLESDNQLDDGNVNRRDFHDVTAIGRTKIQLEKTVFGQLGSKLIEEADCISKTGSIYVPPPDFFLLPNRVWKVKLIGESVDDCGGGYSESITEICDELQNGHLPFLISSPDKDCFVLNPNTDKADSKWFIFLGCLLGIAIRTNQPLSLTISDLIWKILSGQSLCRNDLELLDKDLLNSLMSLKTMEDGELESLQIPVSVTTIDGREVILSQPDLSSSPIVTATNRDRYIEAIIHYKIHEFDHMCMLIRRGMSLVIPLPLLNLFSSRELECLVCGNDSIPISFLKSITLYRGVKSDDSIIVWFWEIMEEMTNEVRSLFLRFVWGRTRLPRYVSDLRGKEFVIQVLSKYSPADDYLPEAYTCFFLLKLPSYSKKAILQEKLLYAIHFCKSIDIDDYARIALNPDSLPYQELAPNISRDRSCSQSSSSGSNSPRIYISNSSSSTSSLSQDDDSDASTAQAPNALFDSSLSLSDRCAIQRNNQYLVSDYMEFFNGVFDAPRFIDMSLDTEAIDDSSSGDENPYTRIFSFPRDD